MQCRCQKFGRPLQFHSIKGIFMIKHLVFIHYILLKLYSFLKLYRAGSNPFNCGTSIAMVVHVFVKKTRDSD